MSLKWLKASYQKKSSSDNRQEETGEEYLELHPHPSFQNSRMVLQVSSRSSVFAPVPLCEDFHEGLPKGKSEGKVPAKIHKRDETYVLIARV